MDHTLYAIWEEESVSLVYNGNGGTITVNDVSVESTTKTVYYMGTYVGSADSQPSASRSGYMFTGWYTEAEGGERVTMEDIVTLAEKHTLYAHWIPKDYIIVFDVNDGDPVGTEKIVTYKEVYGELPVPTREGYRFVGWFTTSTGTKQVTSETIASMTSRTVLYAHWEEE